LSTFLLAYQSEEIWQSNLP